MISGRSSASESLPGWENPARPARVRLAGIAGEGAKAREQRFGVNAFAILERCPDAIEDVLRPRIHPVLTVHPGNSFSARVCTFARDARAQQTVVARRQAPDA